MYPKLDKCEATGKTILPSEGVAKSAMESIKAKTFFYNKKIKKRVKHRMGKPDQCRVYRCPHCKGYHMTSMEIKPHGKQKTERFLNYKKSSDGLVRSINEAEDWKSDSLPFPEEK